MLACQPFGKFRKVESASGIFVLFSSPKHLEAFQNFLNGRHANISFTIADASKYALNKLHAELFQKKKNLENVSLGHKIENCHYHSLIIILVP